MTASAEAARLAYLDSSAVVKLVVREAETDALVRFLEGAELAASELALVEVPRAAHLKTGNEEMVSHAESVLRHFFLVALDDELCAAAARARPRELRSLDALQLASALRIRDQLEAVVIYDRRLGSAAERLGLRVVAPR